MLAVTGAVVILRAVPVHVERDRVGVQAQLTPAEVDAAVDRDRDR